MFHTIIFCFIGLLGITAGQPNYGYIPPTGPAQWAGIQASYSICGTGTRQSPIDINTANAQNRTGLSFRIANAGNSLTGALENLATNVEYAISTPEANRPYFAASYNGLSGYTDGTYVLQQFHFHWGSIASQGSEHLINGQAYVAEVHFVSRNILYSSADAPNMPNGFLVLGVRLRVCSNSQFYPLFGTNNSYLSQLKYYPNEVPDITLRLYDIYNCMNECTTTRKYYIYQGSFTTPACNQAVTWWFAEDSLCISQAQLDILRRQKVNSTGPVLTDNFRPAQDLNGRVVITNISMVSC